jgi:Uncharacterized conserved protein
MPVSETSTPFTLQTLAVLLAGPLAGARAGTAGLVLYLLAGGLGLPVFADGRGGLDALTGNTAGFLWSFLLLPTPLAHLARRIDGSWSGLWFAWFLGAHLLILLLGFGWLGPSPVPCSSAPSAGPCSCPAPCSRACSASSCCASRPRTSRAPHRARRPRIEPE